MTFSGPDIPEKGFTFTCTQTFECNTSIFVSSLGRPDGKERSVFECQYLARQKGWRIDKWGASCPTCNRTPDEEPKAWRFGTRGPLNPRGPRNKGKPDA